MAEKIDTTSSMQDILTMALKLESQACAFYKKALEHARTPEEEQLFLKLHDCANEHGQALERMLGEIEAQLEIDRALSYEVY
ncbi:ferritin-like domain-containing protein [candidate division KSB1 bacterium]|nr:ferritin-like domain-containing protein [candidate division KSB1 bacterium]